jgi:uncharacterized protein (DUF2062 family)
MVDASPRPRTSVQRRRTKNLAVLALLPLLYLLALPHASAEGLAAGLLAPAGLDAFGQTLLAVGLLATRLVTIWLLPAAAAAILVGAALERFTPAPSSPRRTPRA